MHTPGFEFALTHHRADLRRRADDHRAAELARPRGSALAGLRALVAVAGGRRPAMGATTMAEAQPCPP
ncbi:hypothetical protein ACVGOW_24420 [Pseudonocardia saturnea]